MKTQIDELRMLIGQKVEVSDDSVNWRLEELVHILPDEIEQRFLTRIDFGDAFFFQNRKFARPVEEEEFYYRYEKMINDGAISTSNHMTDKHADENGFTENNGWFKIKESKRKWDH